jgi:hypothetical protein
MKRFHVHVAIENLPDSIRFYSTLFGVEPTVLKTDYTKWMLEDPRINFAISARGDKPGVSHLGLQVETAEELADLHARLVNADAKVIQQEATACCYARSDKYWAHDPQGVAWESFRTLGSAPFFSDEKHIPWEASRGNNACCVPAADEGIPGQSPKRMTDRLGQEEGCSRPVYSERSCCG